jgi:hypothetical protein
MEKATTDSSPLTPGFCTKAIAFLERNLMPWITCYNNYIVDRYVEYANTQEISDSRMLTQVRQAPWFQLACLRACIFFPIRQFSHRRRSNRRFWPSYAYLVCIFLHQSVPFRRSLLLIALVMLNMPPRLQHLPLHSTRHPHPRIPMPVDRVAPPESLQALLNDIGIHQVSMFIAVRELCILTRRIDKGCHKEVI